MRLRIAASGAILAFVALALLSGLDRMSALSPSLARLVPPAFAAEAAKVRARSALLEGQGAVAAARDAVAANPYDARALGLLGAALLRDGQGEQAEAVFRLSAQLGWRDGATQLYWFEAARQAGAWDDAALRADAILRDDPQFPQGEVLLAAFDEEAARKALARRVAARPGWAARFLNPGSDVPVEALRARAALFAAPSLADTPFGCDEPAQLARRLLANGERQAAEDLWRVHCPEQASDGAIADPKFAGDGRSPFGWQRHPAGDLAIRAAGEGEGLVLENDGAVTRLALSQAVTLAPGRYRVALRGDAGAAAVTVDCGAPKRPGSVSAASLIEVPACDNRMLGIWMRPRSAARLEQIRLEAVR
ncbi:hypothetical protein VCJ71_06315 [Alteriqipengyuania sp. WL0013]|uniref:hypothetical protein n=1 Tax=Alteriqipengyuania sp. WL0013 TaxID=3110773 RepID=UPI002C341D03|nr:hypothetical protein [Alteriqipengyuania sp. WL0013]MEB3415675.1 hypothetical protein [Alteriqipengyuania sp. WL0013]